MKFSHSSMAHKSTAMTLNALLAAQISDTSFDSPTEALCAQAYLPAVMMAKTWTTCEQISLDDNLYGKICLRQNDPVTVC